jgi:uncharacterized protein YdeI (BOF family)
MKWYGLTGLFILLILTALIIQADSAKEEPAEFKNESVKIIDILENQSAIDNNMVVVEGKIELECASGCWFVLNDDTASIYIDILPNNFVIPQKSGSEAKVYGKVTIKNGDPQIIGKIVEIGGEIYQ